MPVDLDPALNRLADAVIASLASREQLRRQRDALLAELGGELVAAGTHCQRDPVMCRYRHGWIPIVPSRGDRVQLDPTRHGKMKTAIVERVGHRGGKPYFDVYDHGSNTETRIWPEGTSQGAPADKGWERVAERVDVRDIDDSALDSAMRDAVETEDYDRFDTLTAEADARDTRRAAAEARERQRRGELEPAKSARDVQAWVRYEQLTAAGVPDDEAFARASGMSLTELRHNQAINSLRDAGYQGRNFDALARASYRDQVTGWYFRAEDETRGHMLTRDAQNRGIDARSLFTGSEARARRWASDELKEFWDQNGRVTYNRYREQLLGGTSRRERGTDGDFLT